MSKSDYLEQKILDHIYNIGTFTPPATLYVALFTGDPGEDGSSNEVSGNGYARVAVTNDSAHWARTSSFVSNVSAVTFTGPTPATWGTVTHFGLFTASSGTTNYWGGDQLETARDTTVGVDLTFAAGDLSHSED